MVVGSPTKLNLIPSGVMPVVYINQGDAGYDKEFLVYNGDSPYNVPAGVSATIRGKKADGYGVTEAAALTTGSNLVTVTITEQMVAAAGSNLYELVFVDTDGLRIATINMVWAVKKDALGDAVISDSDLDYATQVMNNLQSVSAYKAQLDATAAGLIAETNARITADNSLDEDISDEAAARAAADAALQLNINAEASARGAKDNSLQAQINQLVAPTGSAPSAAEVENARIGADGRTYTTLGDAIRSNDNTLKNRIAYDMVRPVVVSHNKFNPNTAHIGAYIYTDGNLTVNADWFYSDPIYLNGASKVIKSAGVLTFWAADGTFISGAGTGTTPINVPANAEYCIVSSANANLATMRVNFGSTLMPYDNYTVKIGVDDIDEDVVTENETILPSVHSPNLFDKSKITEGYYINATGDIAVAAGWFYSEPITYDIVPGETYSKQGVCAIYDKHDNLLAYHAASVTTLTMPENAAYVRLSRTVALVDTCYLIKGTTVTADLEYYVKFGKEQIDIPRTLIVDINGNGDYSSLARCVKKHAYEVCDIYVRPGTYDLYQEFSDLYGDAFTTGSTVYEGISINKGTRIFLNPGAVIRFVYTGSVQNIIQYFSPFKFDGTGGELHGGKIIASNCRYAIHDDVYAYSIGPSKSVIDRVEIEFNNPTRNVCIGGGMGPNSEIEVKHCIFKQTTDGSRTAIFYHNAATGQAQGKIFIHDNYCDNGKIYVQCFGETTLVTTALVTGNRCYSVSKVAGDVDNMELIAFNNLTDVNE